MKFLIKKKMQRKSVSNSSNLNFKSGFELTQQQSKNVVEGRSASVAQRPLYTDLGDIETFFK